MIETDMDRLARRVNEIYGERKNTPDIPPVYLVTPPPSSRPREIDEARGLVLAFLRELPDVALTLAAFTLILVRDAWRWCRQWKRVRP